MWIWQNALVPGLKNCIYQKKMIPLWRKYTIFGRGGERALFLAYMQNFVQLAGVKFQVDVGLTPTLAIIRHTVPSLLRFGRTIVNRLNFELISHSGHEHLPQPSSTGGATSCPRQWSNTGERSSTSQSSAGKRRRRTKGGRSEASKRWEVPRRGWRRGHARGATPITGP
jgi:hypothetical protein